MPGIDEELGREIEQKAQSTGQSMLYRLASRIRPANNNLGLDEKRRRAEVQMAYADPIAHSDIRARDALRNAGAPDVVVEGHFADNVPYKTLAAASADEAMRISTELSYFGIEHYRNLDEMCGKGITITDAEHNVVGALDSAEIGRLRESGHYRQAIDAETFESRGPNHQSGLYEIYVPDRELQSRLEAGEEIDFGDWASMAKDADPSEFIGKVISLKEGEYTLLRDIPKAQRDFIEHHDISAVRERLSGLAACVESRSEVFWNTIDAPSEEALHKLGIDVDEVLGKNFSIDVETVRWDPEATIITDSLTELGIDWEMEVASLPEGKAPGLARIAFNERHADYVKQVVDDLSDYVRGFSTDRIGNYEELSRVAREGIIPSRVLDDVAMRSVPLPEETRHYITNALQEMNIEYAMTTDPEDGTYTIAIKESELRRHGYRLNQAANVLNEVRPPEFQQQAQRAYEKSAQVQANRSRMNRKLENARAHERDMQRQRNAKVARDVQTAKKSAEAQKNVTRETTRRHTLGR